MHTHTRAHGRLTPSEGLRHDRCTACREAPPARPRGGAAVHRHRHCPAGSARDRFAAGCLSLRTVLGAQPTISRLHDGCARRAATPRFLSWPLPSLTRPRPRLWLGCWRLSLVRLLLRLLQQSSLPPPSHHHPAPNFVALVSKLRPIGDSAPPLPRGSRVPITAPLGRYPKSAASPVVG